MLYKSYCKKFTAAKSTLLLLIMGLAVCFSLSGCDKETTVPDGDLDDEIEPEIEIEIEEEEEEERDPPESPEGARNKKTLWRDEVETGQLYTLGFLPRDYFGANYDKSIEMTMIWDNVERRVLAIDAGNHNRIDEYDFIIYSLTEEKSEVLDRIHFPDPEVPDMSWSNFKADIFNSLIIDNKLLWSFEKPYYFHEHYVGEVYGILSYDLESGDTSYLYLSLEDDYLGALHQVSETEVMFRRDSGFYSIDLSNNSISKVPFNCKEDQVHYDSCIEMLDQRFTYDDPFKLPGENTRGFAVFYYKLAFLEKRDNGYDVIALANTEVEYPNHEELCESTWLPFGAHCSLWCKKILDYKDQTYIFSSGNSSFFKVNLNRGGLERRAGIHKAFVYSWISDDGTPAEEAYLGSIQSWTITDDGDVLWVFANDYSVRGIKGPLEEWTN